MLQQLDVKQQQGQGQRQLKTRPTGVYVMKKTKILIICKQYFVKTVFFIKDFDCKDNGAVDEAGHDRSSKRLFWDGG
jgi:hypothetical protein